MCNFDWHSNIDQETRKLAEDKITRDLEGPHSPIKACHGGPIRISLASPDPFNETVTGNVRCECGAVIGVINGTSDGAKMTYSRVQK